MNDHFELCLAKCRTSSTSVQHENTYRSTRTIFWYIAETITIAICYTYIVWEKNEFMLYCRNKERKYCYGKDAPPTSSSPDPWELILFVPNWWTSTLILLYQTISRSIGHVALVLQPIENPTTFVGILNLHVMLNVTL